MSNALRINDKTLDQKEESYVFIGLKSAIAYRHLITIVRPGMTIDRPGMTIARSRITIDRPGMTIARFGMTEMSWIPDQARDDE